MIFDPSSGLITDGAVTAVLSQQQSQLLAALIAAYPSVVPRAVLMDRVWDGEEEPDGAYAQISIVICHIRQRLIRAGIGPLIQTIWGYGFVATRHIDVVKAKRATSATISFDLLEDIAALLERHPDQRAALRLTARLPVAA